MQAARLAAETAARESYGRLLALLAARSRDIAGAEDALAEAFVAALRTWPERGLPANPDAWLLTAARNTMRNEVRHRSIIAAATDDLVDRYGRTDDDASPIPDERLKLMFVCAHPAIDPQIRTPLMLQTVLGMDAARIAAAFLTAPAAMGQRLVRAKAKIREAGLRFELPDAAALPDRLTDVLHAIYAAFGAGWDAVADIDMQARGLTQEAIYLCRLTVSLLPREPEPRGLLALMLYCEARKAARRDASGAFVPLSRQDARLWSRDMIIEAEGLLTLAAQAGVFGRFQCEAAIQSVHVQRPVTGRTNHGALLVLYRLLAERCPGAGVLIGQAAVLTEAGQAAEALQVLDALPAADVRSHQPYWVTRANALEAKGDIEAAAAARHKAIALTGDPAVKAFLAAMRSASGAVIDPDDGGRDRD